MICVMDNGSTCDGLRERYCHGISEGMALCPFFKTPAQAKQDNERTTARLKKLGFEKHETRGRGGTKRVRCITTGEVFESGVAAANKYYLTKHNIYSQISGKIDNVRGMKFEYMED